MMPCTLHCVMIVCYSLFRHPNILQLMSACHLSRSLSFVLVFERVRCGSLNYSLYDQVRNIYSKLRCFAVLLYFYYLKCLCYFVGGEIRLASDLLHLETSLRGSAVSA